MDNQDQNPYESPQTDIEPTQTFDKDTQLASRLTRLGAALIDGIIQFAIVMIIVLILGMSFMQNTSILLSIIMSFVSMGIFVALHGYFLKKEGKTIGKKLLGIRIVDMDGNLPEFMPMLMKRYLVLFIIGMIPIVGSIVVLINYLFIFRDDQRCGHDLFADTKVIND